MNFTTPIIDDDGQQIQIAFHVEQYPTTVVINPDGEIIHYHEGFTSSYGKHFNAFLEEVARGIEHKEIAKWPNTNKSSDLRSSMTVEEARRILNPMHVSYDEFKENYFIKDRRSPRYVNRDGIYAYIGVGVGIEPWYRLKIQYDGSEWLFIKSVIFRIDGNNFTITPSENFMRKAYLGGVAEWIDLGESDGILDIISRIGESSEVAVRFQGKEFYYDRKLSKSELDVFEKIILAHEALQVLQEAGLDLADELKY